MLASKIKEIRNGRVIVKDSKTKDEKVINITTPKWEGDIKIIDGTHFEMKEKGSDRWSWALHIGQADDHILNALKAKGVLKDNGRFFITDSKTKDAKTKHEYKGYVLEWDNENNKIPAKIISPKGKIIFTYAIGAQPTITGFNSKVELDLSKTKDGEAEESFIKANLASSKIDYIAAVKELMSLGYSQPDAMRTVRIWLGNDAMHAVRQMR